MNKDALRKKYKQIRDGLNERPSLSHAICEEIINLPEYTNAGVVAGYYPIGSEVDIIDILTDVINSKKTLALPVCTENGSLEFKKVLSLNNLQKRKFGILEPMDDSEDVPHEKIDFMLVPALVFDKNGHRIGYGKGYYDKTLIKIRSDCMTSGVAFGAQIIPSINAESFDVPVKKIIFK